MFRSVSARVVTVFGAFVGVVFSVVQNNLVHGELVPSAFIIPAISGALTGLSVYLCLVLTHRNREVKTDLEYNDALLKSITSSAPIGIGLARERIFVHVNDHFCSMLGYEPNELLGRSLRIIYPDDHEFKLVERLNVRQIEESGTGTIETKMVCKDGTTKYVILTCTPLDSDYSFREVAFTALDISIRKRMEQELKKSFEELECRKDAYKEAHRLEQLASIEKSNFQANMSHEIRTPLNGMLGMLQVLHSNLTNEDNIETVNYAIKSCRRLADLLNDIIEITRIEGGKELPLSNPFDVRDILDTTKSLFMPPAEQKGLSFELDMADELPPILVGDDKKLQQILNNIVGNGVKFTSVGGVAIGVQPLSMEPDVCRILFTVSDTGIGIPEDKLEHIFSPYSQVDGSSTRQYEGAGLGLAIVKKLIDVLGGQIEVSSEIGKGTSISFSLEFRVPCTGIDY